MPDYPMSSIEDIYRTLNSLDSSCKASKLVRDAREIESTCTFGFSDLIPLAAPMFRLENSTHTHIPTPSEYCVGLTCHREGFVVFHRRLREDIRKPDSRNSERRTWVLEQHEILQTWYVEWEDEIQANMNGGTRNLDFLNDCHDRWETCTQYFEERQVAQRPLRYLDLVAAHIKHAVHWNDAWEHLRGDNGKKRRDLPDPQLRDWIAEGAQMYWRVSSRSLLVDRGWQCHSSFQCLSTDAVSEIFPFLFAFSSAFPASWLWILGKHSLHRF